ncbi:UDP-N-acetyl glucosamine 2-epimerase [Candidatus Woesearchaeota archaeon]|nr:UDP-N-acetyl glucosamine 2-epimerase [Candidatus Woesearchaeota archaeon]
MKIQDSYDSMFGEEERHEPENFMPNIMPLTVNKDLIRSMMEKAKTEKKWVLAFVIGTKPCFYKFYGGIVEAEKAGIPYLIINSNQHYDDLLTTGLDEFNLKKRTAVNLSIRGDLAQKSAELMIKLKWLAGYLKEKWPSVIVVPVVLGDTILTAIVPPAWTFSRNERAIQNEAGLRSMTPVVMEKAGQMDAESFIDQQFNGEWKLLRNEPFPEQWDTFISAAGSEFLFAPTELNRQHLLREGHPEKNIWVTGGVVVDALELKKKQKPQKSIFEIYPQLEQGRWIRMDIHRRGNLTPRRFKAIVGSIKKMVEKGFNINFIEMSATRMALDHYGFRDELKLLAEKNKNFLFTKIWPEYAHVVEFFRSEHCFAALTDSGGVQEEMNLLDKPCLTCRFNTDRPETVNQAKSNILVPPVDADFVLDIVRHVHEDENLQKSMAAAPKLYGKDIGKKFISIISGLIEDGERPFKWAHEALGLWKEDREGLEYL